MTLEREPLRSSRGFETFVLDYLADAGDVLSRRVFGAIGLYCDGAFFGIIAGDARYFRVDAETRAACQAQGSRPFKPYADRPDDDAVLEAVPLAVVESAPELVRRARTAVAVVKRAK